MSNQTYKGTPAQMLLAAATIANSALDHEAFLTSKRPAWKPPFFSQLKADIETTVQQHLGVVSIAALMEATQKLLALQKQALTALAEAKVQIEVDFDDKPERRTIILKSLGFTDHFSAASRRDQQALTDLLYTFQTHLPSLKAEIIAEGIDGQLLDNIAALATNFAAANVEQEGSKGSRTEVTATAAAAFEAIYKRIAGVCKIAAKFFKTNPEAKARFTYTRVLKAISPSKGGGDTPPDMPTA